MRRVTSSFPKKSSSQIGAWKNRFWYRINKQAFSMPRILKDS